MMIDVIDEITINPTRCHVKVDTEWTINYDFIYNSHQFTFCVCRSFIKTLLHVQQG